MIDAEEAEARENEQLAATGESTTEATEKQPLDGQTEAAKTQESQEAAVGTNAPAESQSDSATTDSASLSDAQNFNTATSADGLEKIIEEDEAAAHLGSSGGARKDNPLTQSRAPLEGGAHLASVSSSNNTVEMGTIQPSLVPQTGPETLEFIEGVKKTAELLRNMQSHVVSLTGSEPALIEINRNKGINITVK